MIVYIDWNRNKHGAYADTVKPVLVELVRKGFSPVTALPPLISGDEIIRRCDAVLLIGDVPWSNADHPKEYPPVYQYPDLPAVSPTEIKYPQQIRGFMDIIMNMYRVHLLKNEDYSPTNIAGPGEIGIATRMWDKMARLMNLVGFDIEIKSTKFNQPKEAKNESIEDNALDLANYGVIFQLFRQGKWAK